MFSLHHRYLLIVDGMCKAENLRDRKRVEQIGKILADAIDLPA